MGKKFYLYLALFCISSIVSVWYLGESVLVGFDDFSKFFSDFSRYFEYYSFNHLIPGLVSLLFSSFFGLNLIKIVRDSDHIIKRKFIILLPVLGVTISILGALLLIIYGFISLKLEPTNTEIGTGVTFGLIFLSLGGLIFTIILGLIGLLIDKAIHKNNISSILHFLKVLIFLLVTMIIGSFVVIAINFTDTSCLSSDDKCLLEKAISEGNPNICENSQWCYMKYYSDQDSSVCSSMPDKIDVYGSGVIYYNYRDKCYKYFAYKENNAVLCDLIQRKETRDHCLKDIQLDRENNTVDTKTESDSEVAYIAEPSKDITDRFIHITVEDEVDDQTKDWQVYTNDKLAIQFKYPPNWIARERNTEYNNRIYIENGENKDFVIGGFPKDFATMWFDFKEPSPDSLSYNQLLVRLANFQCNKKYITRGSTNIYMCEFTFDPESEGHVGPRLEALWKHNGIKYSADTSDMVLGTNDWDTGLKQNELEVEVLKNVLSTLVFY